MANCTSFGVKSEKVGELCGCIVRMRFTNIYGAACPWWLTVRHAVAATGLWQSKWFFYTQTGCFLVSRVFRTTVCGYFLLSESLLVSMSGLPYATALGHSLELTRC
jgi:hypothetical protein